MGLPGADHVVVWLFLLKHQPHGANVIGCIPPIATRIQVTQKELLLNSVFDARNRAGDLASDKSLAAARRFMVEENPARRMDSIALAIVHGNVVPKDLGAGIRAARMKGRLSL